MDRIEPMSTKLDRIGPNCPKNTEVDQTGLNRTNMVRMDLIGPKWAEDDRMDKIEILNIYPFHCIFRAHYF